MILRGVKAHLTLEIRFSCVPPGVPCPTLALAPAMPLEIVVDAVIVTRRAGDAAEPGREPDLVRLGHTVLLDN